MPTLFIVGIAADKIVLHLRLKRQNCLVTVIKMTKQPIILALIERRKASGITQEEAAEMAALSLKTYQRIENGTADMRIKNYVSLINNLKLSDLDVVLDVLGIKGTTPWDVAAAARVLPPEARAAMVSMIMIIYRDTLDVKN